MRYANVVAGLVLAVVGLLTIFVIIPWQIAPGPEGYMSPRLVPTMMMVLITGLALVLVVNNIRAGGEGAEQDEPQPFTRTEMLAVAKIGGVFAISVALYLWVLPLAAGAALVVGALLVLGERRPMVIVLMPTGLLLAIWVLFYKVLGTAIV
jgi:putative tricarboxylic transport membrane protein